MSRIKSPDDKKRKSYKKDCRNTYDENSKASRKNIPRSKRRGHMAERHAVADALRGLNGHASEVDADKADSEIKVRSRLTRLSAFKKVPDKPLGEYLKRRMARRARAK
ncbi:hypothetical protein [Pseudomonas mangrovi]|uniref:hypothetical protein n=1 Tax=Pseudomonas mangrovi TaxID=2161748 RepID=UPI0011B2245E|nr:hypothetical protein [Pseudomonas mangrovi]